MSSPPKESDPLEKFPQNDSRYYIVRNVVDISETIVRGKKAGKDWEIWLYRGRSILTGVLGGAGGSGLTFGFTQSESYPLPFLIGGASFALAIGIEVYNHFQIEARATQAIKARDAFQDLYVNMTVTLKSAAPDDAIVQMTRTADTLIQTFSKVIDHDQKSEVTESARAMARELVKKYADRWGAKKVSPTGRSFQ